MIKVSLEKYCEDCCNNNSYRVCEIFGFSFYCEDKSEIYYDYPSCFCCCWECVKLSFCTGLNCLWMIIYSLCFYLLNILCCCCQDENDRCCKEYKDTECKCELEDYKKKHQCFCYCYESKRWQDYVYQYLTSDVQSTIFPYIIEYFILKLMTSAFEKQYLNFESEKDFQNSNYTNISNFTNLTDLIELYSFSNVSNNPISSDEKLNNSKVVEYLFTLFIFAGTFFCYFYFTLTFHIIIKLLFQFGKSKTKKYKIISNRILDGAHGILIFNGLYSLIFSSLYLSNSEHYYFKNINFFLVPILMNKFYYFTLTYFCISYAQENKQLDVISGDTLISIYLLIWDIIISFIIDYSPL